MWKEYVVGYYEAHPDGRLRSLDRYIKHSVGGGLKLLRGRIMRPSLTSAGYPKVTLYVNGLKVYKAVHRIIAETFLDNPNNLETVNHKDGNKLNNAVENLEWCDITFNNNHALDSGLRRRTEDTVCAKLNREDVRLIRETMLEMSDTKIAEKYGVHSATINCIRRNKTWK